MTAAVNVPLGTRVGVNGSFANEVSGRSLRRHIELSQSASRMFVGFGADRIHTHVL